MVLKNYENLKSFKINLELASHRAVSNVCIIKGRRGNILQMLFFVTPRASFL
jgi:hypothetical protein